MSKDKSIIEEIIERKEREKKRKSKKEKLTKKIKEWSEKGWEMTTLKTKLEEEENIEDLYKEYKDKLKRLKILRSKYKSLPSDLISELDIEEDLKDPDMVDFWEERFDELRNTDNKKIKSNTNSNERNEIENNIIEKPSTSEEWKTILNNPEDHLDIFNRRNFDEETEKSLLRLLVKDEEVRKQFKNFATYWNRNHDGKYFEKNKNKLEIINIKKPHYLGIIFALTLIIENDEVGIYKGGNSKYFNNYISSYNKIYDVIEESKEIKSEEKEDIVRYFIT